MVVNDEMPELDKELIILLTSAALVGSSDSEWLRLKCVQAPVQSLPSFCVGLSMPLFAGILPRQYFNFSEFCSPWYCWQSGT